MDMNSGEDCIDIAEYVATHCTPLRTYSEYFKDIKEILGRHLTMSEKNDLTYAIILQEAQIANNSRKAELCELQTNVGASDLIPINIIVCTAYSTNYDLGKVTEGINRLYAQAKGYQFAVRTMTMPSMLECVHPRTHCTWFKVVLIRELLGDASWKKTFAMNYILWIDADAIVVNWEKSVEDIIRQCEYRDLIVGEDITPCCLINAGVLLIKDSEYSSLLWSDVWECSKYFDVFYYEQSALLACLRIRREGLERPGRVFHSYMPGGTSDIKFFAHVAVFPHEMFNSNTGYFPTSRNPKFIKKVRRSKERARQRLAKPSAAGASLPMHDESTESKVDFQVEESSVGADISGDVNAADEVLPQFVFHPAGNGDKLEALQYMIQRFHLPVADQLVEHL